MQSKTQYLNIFKAQRKLKFMKKIKVVLKETQDQLKHTRNIHSYKLIINTLEQGFTKYGPWAKSSLPVACLCKWSFTETQPCSFIYIFVYSLLVATETLWHIKSKIFIISVNILYLSSIVKCQKRSYLDLLKNFLFIRK